MLNTANLPSAGSQVSNTEQLVKGRPYEALRDGARELEREIGHFINYLENGLTLVAKNSLRELYSDVFLDRMYVYYNSPDFQSGDCDAFKVSLQDIRGMLDQTKDSIRTLDDSSGGRAKDIVADLNRINDKVMLLANEVEQRALVAHIVLR